MSLPPEDGPLDTASDQDATQSELPSSEWEAKILRARPEVLELYERSRPLTHRKTYGRQIGAATTEARHVISHENVMQLILNFLNESGYQKSLEKLEQETNIKRNEPITTGKPTLVKLLEMSVKDVSTVLDPSFSNIEAVGVEGDTEVQVFDFESTTFEETDSATEVNIWDEGPANSSNLVLTTPDNSKHEIVTSATFNKLIEYITSSKGNIDTRLLVLATYRSWTTADKFFDKLVERYSVPESVAAESDIGAEKFISQVRLNVILTLKSWLIEHPKDFSEQQLNKIRDFVENRLAVECKPELVKNVRVPLLKLMDASKKEDDATQNVDVTNCPDPKVPKSIFSPYLTLEEVPREEIARQMTLIDFQLFSGIRAVEFLSRNWTKSSNVRSSAVAAIITRFNQIVKWVVTSVLKTKKHKERAKVIANFSEIAGLLLNMQSYNTMAAIYSGLTHTAVYRLSHTFNEIPSEAKKTLHVLGNLLHPGGSFAKYKEAYKAVTEPPCVPFLGAHLQDIAFIEETVPDRCGEMINMAKRRLLRDQIQIVLRYYRSQNAAPPFLPVQQISRFLHKFDVIKNENDMFKLSLLLEPKGITSTALADHEENINI